MNKNMFRKILAFSLCVMVAVASFAGAVTVSAESSVEGYYGTEADGIEAKAYKLLTLEATDAFRNGDFSEGLKYWGPIDSKGGKASDNAVVSDGIVTVSGTTAYKDGISSVRFKLPYLSAGDKVVAFATYKSSGNARMMLYQRYKALNDEGNLVDNENKNQLVMNSTNDAWVRDRTMSLEVMENFEDFYITIQQTADGEVSFQVSDIQVVVYKDPSAAPLTVNASTGEVFYSVNGTPYIGTVTDGIELPEGKIATMPATDNYMIDLENTGLKYFGAYKGGKASGSAGVSEDGVLSLLNTNAYYGITSLNFKLPNVPVGSKIALGMEYCTTAADSRFSIKSASASQTYNVPNTSGQWKFARTTTIAAVENGEYSIRIDPTVSGGSTALFKNPRIYIYDATDSSCLTDAVTGERVIADTGKPVDGTVADGVEVKSYKFFTLPVNDSLNNLDFSEGLKYWGPVNSLGGKASDYVTLADGALSFKGSANAGVYSRVSKISGLDAESKIAVFYDYITPNSGDISVAITEHNVSDPSTTVSSASSSTYPMTATDEWKTGRTGTLNVASVANGFSVSARQSVASTTAKVKNFRIALQLSNGLFRSLTTDEIFNSDGSSYGGTEADGVTADVYKFINMAAADSLMNADFSQGLKYWGALNGRGGKASDSVTLTDGVISFKATEANYGINTLRFMVNELNVNEGLVVQFDYMATGSDARVTLFGYDEGLNQTSNAQFNLTPTDGAWKTAVTSAVTKTADTDTFMIDLRQTKDSSDAQIKNIRIYKADKGGLGYTELDGSLIDSNQLGDANNDNVVDIRDIVRLKRHLADSSQQIFFTAAKFDTSSETLNANDLSQLAGKLILL